MAEPKARFHPLTLLGDGLLLVCAAIGLAVSFLSLYSSPETMAAVSIQGTVLNLCAARTDAFILAAAVFALLALAAWSLPRFWGAAAGGLAIVWAGAVVLNWERVVQGAGLTAHAVTLLFSCRVDWGHVLQYDPGLTQLEEEGAAALFLLLALAGLALALGWVVVRARCWWAVLLLTLPPLLPGLLADLYPSWPGFMALCACWCAMLLTHLCKWAAPGRRGVLTLAALPAVGLVLAGMTFMMPREGYTRPGWALDAEDALYSMGSRLGNYFSLWEGTWQSTVNYVGSAQDADLAGAGPLNYTGRTMLRVTSDYDGRLYLRGSALGRYEDGRWTDLGEGVYQEYLDALAGAEGGDLSGAPSPLLFPGMSTYSLSVPTSYYDPGSPTLLELDRPVYTATIENVRASGVHAPYELLEQDWAETGIMPVRDSFLAQRPGLPSYTLSFTPPVQGASIRTDSLPERYYRGYVEEHYLDVPDGLREPLLEVCYRNGPYSSLDPVDAAQRIARILNTLCEYDHQTPAAPEGVDPVLYFLNDSHRGYCMHFASAAALMLRTMGVPARYVSGYTAETVPGREADVPDYAAHAWVEVYVDGYGWYQVEVTPAAAFTWYEQEGDEPSPVPPDDAQGSEAPEPTPTPSQAPETPSAGLPKDEGDGPQGGGAGFAPLIRAGKWLAAIAVAAALLWLGQYLPKRRRAKRMAGPDPNRAALDGYGCLLRLKRWGGQVDPLAAGLAQKARFSQHTLTQEELAAMQGFVDRERERLCAALGPVRRLAFLYLWGRPKTGKNTGKTPKNGP